MITRTTLEDTAREDAACKVLERAWKCKTHRTAYLDGLDLCVLRDGRTVGIGEIKNRTNLSTQYPTIYVSFHKYHRLVFAAAALEVKGIFVVNYADKLCWIDVKDIDARRHGILGRTDREDAPNDTELIIEVPVDELLVVETK